MYTKITKPQTNKVYQRKPSPQDVTQLVDNRQNKKGLPDNLKSGIESLSGYTMDDVNVHYNSTQPAQLNAHAFAQGSDIHLATGQEQHLPHEAWHVVQQKQGRVKPTVQMKDKHKLNDDSSLEKEADVMGAKALNTHQLAVTQTKLKDNRKPIQRVAKLNQNTLKDNRPNEVIQLKKRKKNAAREQVDADISVGTEVTFLSDTIGSQYFTIEKGATAIVESFSNTGKTVLVKMLSPKPIKDRTFRVGSSTITNLARHETTQDEAHENRFFDGAGFDIDTQEQINRLSGKHQSANKAFHRTGSKLENLTRKLTTNQQALADPQNDRHNKHIIGFENQFLQYRIDSLKQNRYNNKAADLDNLYKQVRDPLQQFFIMNKVPKEQMSLWSALATVKKGNLARTKIALINQAYGLSTTDPKTIINAQKQMQNWLISHLTMGQIMDVQRSIGLEFEFARYLNKGTEEELSSHTIVGQSSPLSTMFGLDFVLETDSGRELEIGMPPLLVGTIKGAPDKQTSAHMWRIFRGLMAHIRDTNQNKRVNEISWANYGLGSGWHLKPVANDLTITAGRPNKATHADDQVYSQMNISLTPQEIAEFTGGIGKDRYRELDFEHFNGSYQAVFATLNPEINSTQGKSAVIHISKGLANLLAIPSIQMFTNLPETHQANGVYSSVKETYGIWLKDSLPNIVDSSLTTPEVRQEVLTALTSKKDNIIADLNQYVERALSSVEYDLYEQSNQQQYLGQLKNLLENEIVKSIDEVITRISQQKPKHVKNQSNVEFGNEDFTNASGQGVRKETFVNIPMGDNTRLHLAEIRNHHFMNFYLNPDN